MGKPSGSRGLDIVLYGATGFTGRLIAEHIRDAQARGLTLRWAIAGRDPNKLNSVHQQLKLPESVTQLVADSQDSAALNNIASRTRLMINAAGPFQVHGPVAFAACAQQGTDYLDLCGEFNFIQDQIAQHSSTAANTGARMICSAGFDSTPFDAGVYFLQQHARQTLGSAFTRVKCRIRHADIPVSGGTIASFKAFLSTMDKDPNVGSFLSDPFALTPGFCGVEQPPADKPAYDPNLQSWVAPFWMAMINTKNVHRTNFLLGHPYGTDFEYDEMVLTGSGEVGKKAAEAIAADTSILEDPPQPGEGPSSQERESGSYSLAFIGERSDGLRMEAVVDGDMDAGYGSTAKIIAETAFLMNEQPELSSGGIWTPMSALGEDLIKRLHDRAGLTFGLEGNAA